VIRELLRGGAGSAVGGRVGPPTPEPSGNTIHVADERPASDLTLRELLAEDFATHEHRLAEPGFWAIVVHRLGARIDRMEPAPVRPALKAAHKLLATAVDWTWGINLPSTTQVGRRVRVWHNGSIVLDARSIGNDVQIRHDTTFGPERHGDARKPVIEDGADIGSGACVLGAVTVGRGAIVGANSVVLEGVPPGARVLGVPAKVIPDWIARKK